MARLGAGPDTDSGESLAGEDEGTEEMRRLRDDAESDPINEQTESVTRNRAGSVEDKQEQITGGSSGSGGSTSDRTGSIEDKQESITSGDGSSSTSGSGAGSGGGGTSSRTGTVEDKQESITTEPTQPSGGGSDPMGGDGPTQGGSTGSTGGGNGPNTPTQTPDSTQTFDPKSPDYTNPAGQGVEQYGRTDQYVEMDGERVSLRDAATRFETRAAAAAGVDPQDTAVVDTDPGPGVKFELRYTQEGEAKAAAENIRSEYGVSEDTVTSKGQQVVIDTDALNESVYTREGAPGPTARAEGKSLDVSRTGSTADRINAALGGYKAAASDPTNTIGQGTPTPESRRVGQETTRFIARQQAAAQVSEQTGRDVSVEDVQIRDGQVQVTEQEQFGDIDWSFGMGGPEDEVEQALSQASEDVMNAGREFGEFLFNKETGAFRNPAGDDILRAAGQEQLAEDYEREARNFAKGTAQGAAMLANVPGLAKTGLEVIETGSYLSKDLEDNPLEVYETGLSVGAATAKQAAENKASTAGLLVGSLAGSYGIMKLGSKVGPRTGAATRYAIQPGEELAGTLGYRATKATAGTRAADKLFPMQEPLIFSEEAAIMTARKAVPKAKAAGSRLRSEAKSARFAASEMVSPNVETRTGASGVARRAQQELTSARFKLAELRGGPDAPRLETEFESEGGGDGGGKSPISQFLGEERGQASLGKTRTRQVDVGDTDLDADMQRGIKLSDTRSSMRSELGMETELDTETATKPAVEAETESMARSRFEPIVGDAMERQRLAETPELGISQDLGMEVRSRADSDIMSRADTELALDTELDQETFLDLETDVETEFRFESELEQELELETEQELELETELEGRTRQEVEPMGNRPRRRGDDDPFGEYDESTSILDRDLINPFTGE